MQHRRRGRRTGKWGAVGATGVGALLVGGGFLLATGCGLVGSEGGGDGRPSTASSKAPDISCAAQGKVAGSGSTAQENVMEYWIEQYERACAPVQIAYNPVGSGAGVAQFVRGASAFGGSDSPLTQEDAENTAACAGGRAINLPMVGGPIAIGYNVPGVDDLVLDASTLAKIFDSRITTWDDPAIQKLNPGADLPSLDIQAVHRADSSGTTQNLQAYLAGAAPEVWPYEADKSWHGKGGHSADGSSGVAADVTSAPGSIGYFELSFAIKQRIDTVRIDTGAPTPLAPSPETASAGIAATEIVGRGKDLTLEFDYRTTAESTYPITLITYELVCDKGNDPKTLPALKSFLSYTAGDEGQRILPGIHYAPLPESVATEVRKVIGELS
ncbi:phosphate ABC transporter substrate-binding protein PstS [Streptomyces sp. AC495_CC817]|uniref:phosphate ABC transporter substrate-binding protein PstS n=1 Tax=Streptomyces sp. AC495_CC817 TaxID=2823900 RepID=UPI0027E03CDF|nr:phosphate ABC transporter substrate-binding protein PstS [Streptomyces sp. AC495_CC817]